MSRSVYSYVGLCRHEGSHCLAGLLHKGADILTSRKWLTRVKFWCSMARLRPIDPTGACCDAAWSILQQQ
jgi:hypothetical protein